MCVCVCKCTCVCVCKCACVCMCVCPSSSGHTQKSFSQQQLGYKRTHTFFSFLSLFRRGGKFYLVGCSVHLQKVTMVKDNLSGDLSNDRGRDHKKKGDAEPAIVRCQDFSQTSTTAHPNCFVAFCSCGIRCEAAELTQCTSFSLGLSNMIFLYLTFDEATQVHLQQEARLRMLAHEGSDHMSRGMYAANEAPPALKVQELFISALRNPPGSNNPAYMLEVFQTCHPARAEVGWRNVLWKLDATKTSTVGRILLAQRATFITIDDDLQRPDQACIELHRTWFLRVMRASWPCSAPWEVAAVVARIESTAG
jgi:hypothetical protein